MHWRSEGSNASVTTPSRPRLASRRTLSGEAPSGGVGTEGGASGAVGPPPRRGRPTPSPRPLRRGSSSPRGLDGGGEGRDGTGRRGERRRAEGWIDAWPRQLSVNPSVLGNLVCVSIEVS